LSRQTFHCLLLLTAVVIHSVAGERDTYIYMYYIII
jgi:hypothetical protein